MILKGVGEIDESALARGSPMAKTAEEQAVSWLEGRSLASWRDEFDSRGYLTLNMFCRKGVSPKSAPRWHRIWRAISRAATILKA
jgi:hypothetical protein